MAETLGSLTRTHYCGALTEAQVGETVTLMGWAATRRDLGGVVFIDLRDREGLCQVVARPEVSKEAHAAADKVRGEYVLAVVGEVARRSPETVNPKLPTGAVEVLAREIHILAEAKTPPFPIEDEIDTAEDIRLKYRYLDLRRPRLQRNLKLRHRVTMEVRRYMDEQGFYEIETPMLTEVHPRGRPRLPRALARPPRRVLRPAPVAPDLQADPDDLGLRQVLPDRALLPRRGPARRPPARVHPGGRGDVVPAHGDGVRPDRAPVRAPPAPSSGSTVERPFPRLPYAEALLRYGSDKPDLRFDMPIADVTEEMATLGLEGFPALIEQGARARAIALPAAAGISGTRLRKINEEVWLGRIVGDAHASKRNLFVLKATDEAVANLGKKGASETIARRLLEKAGAQKDDTVLVGVDAEGPLAMAMGILRLEMGRELKLIDEKAHRFLWVTNFPLLEYDAAEKRYASLHHPFTAPMDEDAVLLDTDPGKARAKAYDLVLNGYEVGGGSIRIHDSALQAKVFKLLSLSDEEARERFGFFLDALTFGTPPHGGIALGLDRMAMILAGEKSLREVIAFPKTASATDLMAGSPSPVRDEQLRELGVLAIRK